MVLDSEGEFLAWGSYSKNSQIRVRIWSWSQSDIIGVKYIRSQLDKAIKVRIELISEDDSNAMRLVHGESDGVPGLIVDQYADTLVVQFLSRGVEVWRGEIIDILRELTKAERIYERSDVEVRKLEGLPKRSGLLWGSEPPETIEISEYGLSFLVDIKTGHKTGTYLDQRENRRIIRELAKDRDVLDCFCYSGGFSLNAIKGGASSVLCVDSSADVLALVLKNLALNELDQDQITLREDDVFQALRKFRDQGRQFDLIILDPPKFAPTAAHAKRAARGYKDINLLAFKLLHRGGYLATFSCSGGIDANLFQKIVAGAALDAGVDGQIIKRLSQAPDHPVALNFPEGAYLKGLVIRVR